MFLNFSQGPGLPCTVHAPAELGEELGSIRRQLATARTTLSHLLTLRGAVEDALEAAGEEALGVLLGKLLEQAEELSQEIEGLRELQALLLEELEDARWLQGEDEE